jgi:hypothetical protein
MASIITFPRSAAMATTHFVPAVEYAETPACHINGTAERKTVSLSWVVVTDDNGVRQLRMRWALDR